MGGGGIKEDQAEVKMIIFFSLSSNDVKTPCKSCLNTFSVLIYGYFSKMECREFLYFLCYNYTLWFQKWVGALNVDFTALVMKVEQFILIFKVTCYCACIYY